MDESYSDNICESPAPETESLHDSTDTCASTTLEEVMRGLFPEKSSLRPMFRRPDLTIKDIIDEIGMYHINEYHVHNFMINHCNLGIIACVISQYRWKTDDLHACIKSHPALLNAFNNNELYKLLLLIDTLSAHLSTHLKYIILRIANDPYKLIEQLRDYVYDFRPMLVDIYNDPAVRLSLPSQFNPHELDLIISNMTMIDNKLLHE